MPYNEYQFMTIRQRATSGLPAISAAHPWQPLPA
jgi:hypothetical protein